MGFETGALLLGGASSLVGNILGYNSQNAARKRQQGAQDQAVALTQGSNPVDQMILQQLSRPNSGQDGFLQMLRSNPNALKPYMFNYSQAFQDLKANDAYNLQDQISGLNSSAGSLGERFGSGFAAKDAMLRSRYGAAIGARNAGIAQSSFNTALQTGLQGYTAGQSQSNNLLQLLLNSQQGRTQQQLAALGMQNQPLPNPGASIAQGGTDLAQLLLLGKYLGGANGGGSYGTDPATQSVLNQIPARGVPGIQMTPNGYPGGTPPFVAPQQQAYIPDWWMR